MAKKTRIVFILDKSGSMGDSRQEVCDGFNAFVDEQKRWEGEVNMSLIYFDNYVQVGFKNKRIGDVGKLTKREYQTGGGTELYRAVGNVISQMQPSRKDEMTIVTIITDGCDNSSGGWDSDGIRKLIHKKREKKWAITLLGAGIDAFYIARCMGIAKGNVLGLSCSKEAFARAFKAISSSYSSEILKGVEKSDHENIFKGIPINY